MKSKAKDDGQQQFLISGLRMMLDPKQPLKRLAEIIPWKQFEEAYGDKYSPNGRPAKPIRLMVGLLILKQLENLSDERVVEAWTQNPYYQFFCGEETFQWKFPIAPSDLTHFRNHLGKRGVEKILEISASIHGERAQEEEVIVDTTVQEKNITYPTDCKNYIKIIGRCNKIAKEENIPQRRSYLRTVPRLRFALRQRHHPTRAKLAARAERRLRTIAGRLIRELERKLDTKRLEHYKDTFSLFTRVLKQKRSDKNKIYSLHEPQVCCYSKGKEHKKYEFGAKASIVITKTSGIIVGAESFSNTIFDGHTLYSALEQLHRIRGIDAKICIADQAYRGTKKLANTQVITPASSKATLSSYKLRKRRLRLKRRCAIEPVISHLKYDFRLIRCFLKGAVGDAINLLMAAAAFNFRKWIRWILYWLNFFALHFPISPPTIQLIVNKRTF